MPKVVAIVGPTAAGKSALAVALAPKIRGEIVNGDSRQVYAGMEIGTAMPTANERASVPHHLFGHLAPDAPFSLALYRESVLRVFEGCWARDAVPLLVGGTGQYIWAVLEEWNVPEVPPDEALRASLFAKAEARGAEALHARLAELDPVQAARIDGRNVRRVVRALEVIEHTGRPMSELQTRGTPPFESLVLGITLPRDELDARIDRRVDAMFNADFVAEVEALRAAGYTRDLPSQSSIGYAQVHAYLDGEATLATAIDETKRATRRLARRQMAWFRPTDPRIHWISRLEEAQSLSAAFLG